ncbi:MAG: hypothetical protein GVY30_12815 [Chloroflexi bacterium]|nr:hypothetical protein [Chloroflexota bacterium]
MTSFVLLPVTLRRQYFLFIGWNIGLVLVGNILLGVCGLAEARVGWNGAILATMSYEAIFLWRHLQSNHRPNQAQILSRLGAANIITLTRGLLATLLSGWLALDTIASSAIWLRWGPASLYTAIILMDVIDGKMARRRRRVTALGAELDVAWDALSMVIIGAIGIQRGRLPWMYALVPAARYLFLVGLWLRRRWEQPVVSLPPSVPRRAIASFQMGFLSLALWPVFEAATVRALAWLFMAPLLGSFLKDWALVTGRLDWQTFRGRRYLRGVKVAANVGALILRGVVVGWLLLGRPAIAMPALRWPLAGMLAVGFAGRFAAGMLLLLMALSPSSSSPAFWSLCGGVALLHLGTGPGSLWRETAWLSRS